MYFIYLYCSEWNNLKILILYYIKFYHSWNSPFADNGSIKFWCSMGLWNNFLCCKLNSTFNYNKFSEFNFLWYFFNHHFHWWLFCRTFCTSNNNINTSQSIALISWRCQITKVNLLHSTTITMRAISIDCSSGFLKFFPSNIEI